MTDLNMQEKEFEAIICAIESLQQEDMLRIFYTDRNICIDLGGGYALDLVFFYQVPLINGTKIKTMTIKEIEKFDRQIGMFLRLLACISYPCGPVSIDDLKQHTIECWFESSNGTSKMLVPIKDGLLIVKAEALEIANVGNAIAISAYPEGDNNLDQTRNINIYN